MIFTQVMKRSGAAVRVPRGAGRLLHGLAAAAALVALGSVPAQAQGGQTDIPVTLPQQELNANFRQHFGPLYTKSAKYPTLGTTGDALFGGVLFNIPVVPEVPVFVSKGKKKNKSMVRYLPTRAESNFWLSAYEWNSNDEQVQASGLRELEITDQVFNQVPELYLLMGSWWGRRTANGQLDGEPTDFASVTLTFENPVLGEDDLTYTKKLIAGPPNYAFYAPYALTSPPDDADIRDFHNSEFQGRYANVINGTTTQQVFSGTYLGPSAQTKRNYRLDRVRIDVPYPYNLYKLKGIKVSDYGAWNVQRVFVGGITARSGHSASITLLQTYANHTEKTYLQVYRITNTSTYKWDSAVSLVLKNLTPGVTLDSPTGYTTVNDVGSPYVDVPVSGGLLPGQSVVITMRFTTTGANLVGVMPFQGKILAGPGPR